MRTYRIIRAATTDGLEKHVQRAIDQCPALRPHSHPVWDKQDSLWLQVLVGEWPLKKRKPPQ